MKIECLVSSEQEPHTPCCLLLDQVGSTVLKYDGSSRCCGDDEEFNKFESIMNNLPKVYILINFKLNNSIITHLLLYSYLIVYKNKNK